MPLDLLFKIGGVLGMIILTIGILSDKDADLKRNILSTIGGLFLLSYSIYLKDPIFIPLQIIFISATSYEIYKLK